MSGEREPLNLIGHDYLWDRAGTVDPEVARLERLLAPLRYETGAGAARSTLHLRSSRQRSFAAAAVLAMAIGGVWMAAMSLKLNQAGSTEGWSVTAIQGSPRIESSLVKRIGVLKVGQWLETDARSQAKVDVASIGTVKIEPASRVRLAVSNDQEHRLELAHGSIEAFITAPPRLFFVNTPSATAIDLGCKYRLSVDEDGGGILEVTLGWVSLQHPGGQVESIVPSGAMCKTRVGVGPGTPYYTISSPLFQQALERFDFQGQSAEALDQVLDEATPRDSLTLWHLLSRGAPAQREVILARMTAHVPLPEGVSPRAILRGDRQALQTWRDTMPWSPAPWTSKLAE